MLSGNNWDGDGEYDVAMNLWWGTNGTTYRLYENGVLLAERQLVPGTPSSAVEVVSVSGKPVGTYEYRGELSNASGTTSSDPIVIRVTK